MCSTILHTNATATTSTKRIIVRLWIKAQDGHGYWSTTKENMATAKEKEKDTTMEKAMIATTTTAKVL